MQETYPGEDVVFIPDQIAHGISLRGSPSNTRGKRGQSREFANSKTPVYMIEKSDKSPLACRHIRPNHKRILVVDDEDCIREILSTALSGMGYEVVTANSGTEALNLFLRSSFALVLTDLEMPGMDGWNLASRIRDRSPDIPVAVMTGQPKEDVMERIKGNSIHATIFKPFRLEQVLEMIEKLLATEPSKKGTPGSWNNPATHQRTSA